MVLLERYAGKRIDSLTGGKWQDISDNLITASKKFL